MGGGKWDKNNAEGGGQLPLVPTSCVPACMYVREILKLFFFFNIGRRQIEQF